MASRAICVARSELNRMLWLRQSVRLQTDRIQRGTESALSIRWRFASAPIPFLRDPHQTIRWMEQSSSPPWMKGQIIAMLRKLTRAEAAAHRVSLPRVRFFQLGSLDTLLNLMGCSLAIHYFKIQAVHVSPIPIGPWHEGHHGSSLRSVGPVTVRLLRGFPTRLRSDSFEWTTPTAAVFLAQFATGKPATPFRIERIGRAAGHRAPPSGSGLLRLLLAQPI